MGGVVAPARWPGTSTFPGTDQYPGQGELPIVRCSLSTASYFGEPAWTDVTPLLRRYSFSRGRNTELEDFDAGSGSLSFDNRGAEFWSFGTATLNRVRLYAEYAGVVNELFRGYVESVRHTWDQSGLYDAIATVTIVDEFKPLSRYVLPSTTISQAPSHVQIGALLDRAGSHAPRRFVASTIGDLASVNVNLAPDPDAPGVLGNAIQGPLAAEALESGFFAAKDGALVFLPRDHRLAAPYNVIQATFSDQGSNLPYLDCELETTDSYLANEVTISRIAGYSATVSDAASIEAYGLRSLIRTNLPYTTNAQVDATASALNVKYRSVLERVGPIKPNMRDADTAAAVLRLELMDKVRIIRQLPGFGIQTFDSYIQRIEMSGVPGAPTSVTLGVSDV